MPRFPAWQGPCLHKRVPWHITGERRKASAQGGAVMLELRNLSFSVENDGVKKEIIHDLNLVVNDNTFVVVTGPNGSGKSTLAKLIVGIERPTEGRILLDGSDITDLGITERARKGMGFAFQQPVRFKGIRVVTLLRLAAGRDLSVSEACDYLSEVGLCAQDYIQREVNASLSGGELKRIEIATVLTRHSRLTVFDEPEAGIDLWSFQNLIRIFESMRRNIRDSSMIIISHQERILNIADEIAVLADGAIVRHGARADIFPDLIGTESAQGTCNRLRRDV